MSKWQIGAVWRQKEKQGILLQNLKTQMKHFNCSPPELKMRRSFQSISYVPPLSKNK